MIKNPSAMVHDDGQLDRLKTDRSDLRGSVMFFFSQKIDVDSNGRSFGNAKKEKKNIAFVSDQYLDEIVAWWELVKGKSDRKRDLKVKRQRRKRVANPPRKRIRGSSLRNGPDGTAAMDGETKQ
jgi:hypothetical protein